jgi:hypothetical protein
MSGPTVNLTERPGTDRSPVVRFLQLSQALYPFLAELGPSSSPGFLPHINTALHNTNENYIRPENPDARLFKHPTPWFLESMVSAKVSHETIKRPSNQPTSLAIATGTDNLQSKSDCHQHDPP